MKDGSDFCKLCREAKDLADSHIVPEFIYKPLYDEKPRRMLSATSTDEGVQLGFPQKGIREQLLCVDCEQYLNRSFEQKSLATWRTLSGEQPGSRLKLTECTDSQGDQQLILEGHDYASLKLLLLSILWRASVSSLQTYGDVRLGPHEESIRGMILNQNPGEECEYPVILYILDDEDLRNMPPPSQGRMKGHRVYQFLLARVLVITFVTGHLKQESFFNYALRDSSPLRIPIVKAAELPIIKEAVRVWKTIKPPGELI
ncbi:MAG: hypothetical protein SX243_01605 [Acidobacteriota bacterium]|nr:hypothetical protein [Acidobacteriota bacterium]